MKHFWLLPLIYLSCGVCLQGQVLSRRTEDVPVQWWPEVVVSTWPEAMIAAFDAARRIQGDSERQVHCLLEIAEVLKSQGKLEQAVALAATLPTESRFETFAKWAQVPGPGLTEKMFSHAVEGLNQVSLASRERLLASLSVAAANRGEQAQMLGWLADITDADLKETALGGCVGAYLFREEQPPVIELAEWLDRDITSLPALSLLYRADAMLKVATRCHLESGRRVMDTHTFKALCLQAVQEAEKSRGQSQALVLKAAEVLVSAGLDDAETDALVNKAMKAVQDLPDGLESKPPQLAKLSALMEQTGRQDEADEVLSQISEALEATPGTLGLREAIDTASILFEMEERDAGASVVEWALARAFDHSNINLRLEFYCMAELALMMAGEKVPPPMQTQLAELIDAR